MNVYEKDRIRQRLLSEIYNKVDGFTSKSVNLRDIGNELEIDPGEVYGAYVYFIEEMLINSSGQALNITLSHHGLKFVESILRKINFNQNRGFDSTELFQLRIVLDEMKQQISKLELGQKIIFDKIDESFEQSKEKSKLDWKAYFQNQINDWTSQKIIDQSAQILMQALIEGLQVIVK